MKKKRYRIEGYSSKDGDLIFQVDAETEDKAKEIIKKEYPSVSSSSLTVITCDEIPGKGRKR